MLVPNHKTDICMPYSVLRIPQSDVHVRSSLQIVTDISCGTTATEPQATSIEPLQGSLEKITHHAVSLSGKFETTATSSLLSISHDFYLLGLFLRALRRGRDYLAVLARRLTRGN